MKVSLNSLRWITSHYKSTGDIAPDGVEVLRQKIGAQLGGIEEVVAAGKKYDGVLIVKVVSCVDHPNADRLHVCMVDDGGVAQNVPRDENGLVQVVCGAPNVHDGVTVAWLPPGVTVPSTYNDDPFVLEARELRGVVSNGMLASPKELAVGDSHEGLLIIDEEVQPGTLFADKYNLKNDVVIDIENKMFTHRPDCFGWLGVAREIAGIEHQPFKSPDWYTSDARVTKPESGELLLEVKNEIPELVPRFTAVTMSDISIGPSPVWLQIELSRVGLRPINNIVDLTNYIMLLTGQPLHAYDYDKVVAADEGADHATIVVRKPHQGEKLMLLNGKEIEPRVDAILIASASQAIGLGGVMGGANTEVDENTKNIILECANFDMYSIRKTSMHHGIFSDAVTRFNKGQSPLQNMAILAKIVEDIRQQCGGKVAGHVIDDNHVSEDARRRDALYPDVHATAEFVNTRLGLQLSPDEMAKLLSNVEFKVAVDGEDLTIRAPFWRTDIEIPEDVVEEIGRLYGYDKLPLELPVRPIIPAPKDPLLSLKARLREALSRAGANEVLSYSFVHGNVLERAGQNKELAFKLGNALSPDLQYYRVSLTPSLLEKIHPNIKAGYDQFALFEIGKSHVKGESDKHEPDIPMEFNALSLIYAAKTAKPGAPYYTARKYLMALLQDSHADGLVTLQSLTEADITSPLLTQLTAPYEPNRSAVLRDSQGVIWGVVGEFKPGVRKAFKLPDYTAGFEFGPFLLMNGATASMYTPLPRFPRVTQDITLKVTADMPYQTLYDAVRRPLADVSEQGLIMDLWPLDIYQRDDDQNHKQVTFRLSIASYEKTLTDAEVSAMLDDIAARAHEVFGAERV